MNSILKRKCTKDQEKQETKITIKELQRSDDILGKT